ncbi:hypothetical protein [Cupriavidus necator]|uniref:hypothetical protein n=1 Tax=Cupriavidus necator TaxID=106590 RepID=UPI00339D8B0A
MQVLEVARNDLLNLGIRYPGKITGTLDELVQRRYLRELPLPVSAYFRQTVPVLYRSLTVD